MKSDLNKTILSPEDLVRYTQPIGEDEAILFAALKETLAKLNTLEEETEKELWDLKSELADLKVNFEEAKDKLETKDAEYDALLKERNELAGQLEKVKELVTS